MRILEFSSCLFFKGAGCLLLVVVAFSFWAAYGQSGHDLETIKARQERMHAADEIARQPEPNQKNLTSDDIAHVKIARRTAYADNVYKNVLWALSIVPRSLKDHLWSEGVSVTICSSMEDRQRWLARQNGGGPVDPKWKNCGGFTQGANVYIGQTWLDGGEVRWPSLNTLHELGHAFDFTSSPAISNTEQWHQAFTLDKEQLVQGKYGQWVSKELCAQLFAVAILQNAHAPLEPNTPDIEKCFPRCWQIEKQRLERFGLIRVD